MDNIMTLDESYVKESAYICMQLWMLKILIYFLNYHISFQPILITIPTISERKRLLNSLLDAMVIEAAVKQREHQLAFVTMITQGKSPQDALKATSFGVSSQSDALVLLAEWLATSPASERIPFFQLLHQYLVACSRPNPAALYRLIACHRYLNPRERVDRGPSRVNFMLCMEDDARFKVHARASRESFNKLVSLIANKSPFVNDSHCPQAPVEEQLLIALRRLGFSGNAAGFVETASAMNRSGK